MSSAFGPLMVRFAFVLESFSAEAASLVFTITP